MTNTSSANRHQLNTPKPSSIASFSLRMALSLLLLCPSQLQADAVVLLYHHIASDTPPSTSTSVADFRSHLQYLQDNGFNVIPLPQLVAALKAGTEVPDKTAVITFDDGYESIFANAFPLLQQFNMPFTLFLSTGPIDQGLGNYMSWEQIRSLSEAGVTIANHMVTHPYMLTRIEGETEAGWLDRTRVELLKAEQRIETETGQTHRFLAYPYGEYNPALQSLLSELDFIGFAQNSGAINANSDLTALPRFPLAGIYANLDTARTKIDSRAFNVSRLEPAGPVTDSTKPTQLLRFDDGDYDKERISCFAGGEAMEMQWLDAQTLQIRPQNEFTGRRWNYICTAPVPGTSRYFWYSTQWIAPTR